MTTSPASGFDPGMRPGEGSAVDRTQFECDLRKWAASAGIDLMGEVLIVGGSYRDANVVYRAGFRNITLTNIEPMADVEKRPMPDARITVLYADLEKLDMPDGSFDLVVAHEVLHHCRSPHRAVLEMLRVSRKHIVIMEPNDSFVMRALVKLRFSFPYEITAVTGNDFAKGGVQNSTIPNYIYRWDRRSLFQTAAAALPESEFAMHVHRYWDFNVDKQELARRPQTRIGSVTKIVGPGLFLLGLRTFQAIANRVPWISREGNKFFACITKLGTLKPWIVHRHDGYDFNREYGKP